MINFNNIITCKKIIFCIGLLLGNSTFSMQWFLDGVKSSVPSEEPPKKGTEQEIMGDKNKSISLRKDEKILKNKGVIKNIEALQHKFFTEKQKLIKSNSKTNKSAPSIIKQTIDDEPKPRIGWEATVDSENKPEISKLNNNLPSILNNPFLGAIPLSNSKNAIDIELIRSRKYFCRGYQLKAGSLVPESWKRGIKSDEKNVFNIGDFVGVYRSDGRLCCGVIIGEKIKGDPECSITPESYTVYLGKKKNTHHTYELKASLLPNQIYVFSPSELPMKEIVKMINIDQKISTIDLTSFWQSFCKNFGNDLVKKWEQSKSSGNKIEGVNLRTNFEVLFLKRELNKSSLLNPDIISIICEFIGHPNLQLRSMGI